MTQQETARLAELNAKPSLERWEREERVTLRMKAELQATIAAAIERACKAYNVSVEGCSLGQLGNTTYTMICQDARARRLHYVGVSHTDGRVYKLARYTPLNKQAA